LIFQANLRPETTDAALYRSTAAKGLVDMEALRGIPAADRAIHVIHILRPLFEDAKRDRDSRSRDALIEAARHMPFPFLDDPATRIRRCHRSTHSVSPPARSHSPITHPTSSVSSRDTTHVLPLTTHVASANNADGTFLPPHFATTAPQNAYMDRGENIIPIHGQSSSNDESFWSPAVVVENEGWARLMGGGSSKS